MKEIKFEPKRLYKFERLIKKKNDSRRKRKTTTNSQSRLWQCGVTVVFLMGFSIYCGHKKVQGLEGARVCIAVN